MLEKDAFTQEFPDYDAESVPEEIPLYVNKSKNKSGKGSLDARNRAQRAWYHRHKGHRRAYMREYMARRRSSL